VLTKPEIGSVASPGAVKEELRGVTLCVYAIRMIACVIILMKDRPRLIIAQELFTIDRLVHRRLIKKVVLLRTMVLRLLQLLRSLLG